MWEEFLSDRYYPKVLDLAEHFPDRRSLYVNFRDVEIFNPEMADRILESPPQELSDAQTALRSVDLPLDVTFDENTFLRILNLPLTQRYHVNQLRAVHVGKLIAVEGMVRTATEIRPKIVSAMYRCQRCGQEFFKSQSGFQFDDKDIRCGNDACDRGGPFKLLLDQSRFIDAQRLRLQESIEDIGARSIPQILEIEAEGDIAGIINPGDRVIVNGIITSYRKPGNVALSNYFEIYMKVVSIEMEEQEYEEIDISMQDQAEILKLAQKGDVLDQFRQSIAPSIYGNDVIKEALSLQLVSSPEVRNFDGTINRGDIHVLLVGDPGVAKSQMLRYMAKISPRGLYTSGKGTTSAGLTATAVKDEHGDGRWTIEAGALPLSDRGIACIDEMDKMNEKDREGLHEGMEQQCYDGKTEILTERGWIFFRDIMPSDKVAALSHDGNLEYIQPENIFADYYIGDIFYIQSRQVDLAVTPSHNIYVNLNIRADEWEGFTLRKLNELPIHKRMRFKKNANWIGERCNWHIIPSVPKFGNQARIGKETGVITVLMDDWLEFLGYYLSEGSIRYHTKTKVPYTTTLSQVDPYVKGRMIECLERLSLPYGISDKNIYIYSKQLASHLSPLGNCYKKHVPDYIKKLCPVQIRILLDAMVLGDGWIDKKTGSTHYVTSSKQLANDVTELLLKIGQSGNLYKTRSKGSVGYVPGGGLAQAKEDIWVISFIRERQNEPNINTNGAQHIKVKHYNGPIFCVEVPDHVIYVRRNGKPVWCGNSVSIAKAGISATLRCRCSVLAAANPTAGRFDRAGIIADQINLLPTLLSRFDLIFICLDVPDKDQDRELADHILNVRTHPQSKAPVIEPALLRKYIAYARRNIFPELSEEAGKELKEFWLSLRGQYGGKPNQPIPTTARQLEALYRLASASARLRLSATIDGQDTKKAIYLTEYCMKQVGVDPETGLFDVGVIDLGTPKTESDKTLVVERIIRELGRHSQGKAAEEEILAAAFQQGIDEDRARNIISRMRRDGRLVEPRNGFYSFP